MLELAFSVKAETQPEQVIKVIGAIPALGTWNPQSALALTKRNNVWEGSSIQVNFGTKYEFKLIKQTPKGDIIWETLPNNSNRKFKPKYHSKLHLVWSAPQGNVTPIDKSTYKVKGLPATLIKRVEVKSNKKFRQFDPYQNARQDESDSSDQEQFMLARRKMSDQIIINSGDLEDIYYTNSSLEICCGLLRKIKVYVISKECQLKNPLHALVEQQLGNLPSNYMARWITIQSFFRKSEDLQYIKFQKRGSLFDVKAEELHLEALYSLTSYFILLELETAIKLSDNSCRVPTCLFLPAVEAKSVMKVLPRLSHIQLICYDDPEANKDFYQYLKSNNFQEENEDHQGQHLHLVKPSIMAIIEQLQRLRYHQPETYNTLCHISEEEGLTILTQDNSVCILDGEIIQKYPHFSQKLLNCMTHSSLLIVICREEHLSPAQLGLKDCKNVALIFDSFEKVILDGKEYHPLRKFKEAIELFRMKSKLYLQKFGGKIAEKESSFIYWLPEGKEDWATKVQTQCLAVVSKFDFVRVSRKGIRVKVSWNLAKQARLIRTLCEIKYLNYGVSGNFHLLVHQMSFKTIKQDLNLLIEHKSKLFLNKNATKITYHSFDFIKPTISNIIPSSDKSFTIYEVSEQPC